MPKLIISLPHELIIKILRYNGDYIFFGKQHQYPLLDVKYLLRIPKIRCYPGDDVNVTKYEVRLPITNNKLYKRIHFTTKRFVHYFFCFCC